MKEKYVDPLDVERIKQIVLDELGPALAKAAKEIEDRMTAHHTAFQQQIELRVEQRHSESRARLQMIDDNAREAVEQAQKAVAGNDYIVDRLGQQDARGEKTQALVQDLLGEVRGLTGRRAGIAEAEAKQDAAQGKRNGILKWGAGTLVSGGAVKWLASHFHWFGGK